MSGDDRYEDSHAVGIAISSANAQHFCKKLGFEKRQGDGGEIGVDRQVPPALRLKFLETLGQAVQNNTAKKVISCVA